MARLLVVASCTVTLGLGLLGCGGGPATPRAGHRLEDVSRVLPPEADVVLLARRVTCPDGPSLGVLPLVVERNAYGRQIASGIFPLKGDSGFPDAHGTFIRAPRIAAIEAGATPAVVASER